MTDPQGGRFQVVGPLGAGPARLGRTAEGRSVVLKRGGYSAASFPGCAAVLEATGDTVVREFLPGPSLAERLREGPLPAAEVLDLARRLVETLDGMHRAGALHGRVKPTNLFDGVLTDAGPEVEEGDPDHLAPEAAGTLREAVGPPADLYSLGAVLFHALTGRPPFHGLRAHLTDPVPALEGVPEGLDALVARLLAKAPRDRYESAAGVRDDLDRLGAGFLPGRHERRARLAAPALVGRGDAMRRLADRLGGGGVVVVTGPPGIGKTRLVEEALRHATARGHLVLRSRARADGPRLPLQVLDELAQDLLSRGSLQREALGAWGPVLAAAMPALEPLLGPAAPSLEPGPLKAAVPHFLAALGSASRPAVVLIEDLQGAGADILDLLRTPSPHTLVLLTSREPLAIAAEHVALDPLTPREIRALLPTMGGPLPEAALDLLAEVSEGNPLLAVESVQALVEGGGLERTPAGWRFRPELLPEGSTSERAADVFARRLGRLSPGCLRLLGAAALVGRQFEAWALEGVNPREEVLRRLEEALEANLVRPLSGDGWLFVHDRLREECRNRLDPAERRHLHGVLADHLERIAPERIHDLSWHLAGAGRERRALPYALRAGDEARRRSAMATAELHYEIALRAAPGDLRILEALGDVQRLAGRHPEARESYLRALEAASTDLERARIEGRLGEVAFRVGDLETAGRRIGTALTLLGHAPPAGSVAGLLWEVVRLWLPRPDPAPPLTEGQRLSAHLLDALAYVLAYRDGPGLIWANLRSLNLTERAAPSPEKATACASHAVAVLYVPWLLERSRRYIRRAVALEREVGTPEGLARARAREASIALWTDSPERAEQIDREVAPALERAGDRFEVHMTGYNLALALYRRGDLAEARTVALENARRAREVGDRLGAALSLRVVGCLGALPPEEPTDDGDHPHLRFLAWEREGLRRLDEGNPDLALEPLERALAGAIAVGATLDRMWLECWLAAALRLAAEGLPVESGARRRDLLRRARALARSAVATARHGYRVFLPRALREVGALACERGHRARARRTLEESRDTARELGMRYEEALTLLALARAGWASEREARESLAPLGRGWEVASPRELRGRAALTERLEGVLSWGRELAAALDAPVAVETARRAAEDLLRAECRVVRAGSAGPGGLSIPLRVRGRLVAELACASPGGEGFFGPKEVRLATFVGAVAEAALENAELLKTVQDREARLDAVFAGVGVGIALVDRDGRVAEANPILHSLVGHEVIREVYRDDRAAFGQLLRALLRGERESFLSEVRWVGAGGRLLWAEVRATALPSVPRSAVLAVSDVSSRRLEQVARFQESERRLVAAEVHDVISQPLVGLLYRLEALAASPPNDRLHADVVEAAELGRRVLDDVRGMIYQLATPSFEQVDLGKAVREYVEGLEGVEVRMEIAPEVERVSGLPAVFAYRIVLEGLANVRRHSRARSARLRLRVRGEHLHGLLADDGQGFDPEEVSELRFGLRVLRERAGLVGGRARVHSRPGHGTLLRFVIPLEAR